MAESLAFDLKLVDSVSANANRAASALKVVEDRAKKAQNALDFGKERGRAEFNLKKLSTDPKGYVALIKAQKELKEQRNKLLGRWHQKTGVVRAGPDVEVLVRQDRKHCRGR